MIADIVQQQDPRQQTIVGSEKRDKFRRNPDPSGTPVFRKSDTKDNSRADRNIADRLVSLAIFFTSGAITAGGLTALVFDGWLVALGAILGGVWGMFVAALCQVSSEARSR